MNKLIALCLAVSGFAALPVAPASAHEALVSAPAAAVSSLPPTVRINETVVVRTRDRHHRRYRTERHRVRRHGKWTTVTRRIYY